MGFFGWIFFIIFVLVIVPVAVGGLSGLISSEFKIHDDTTTYSSKRVIIEFVAFAVLHIWAIIDIISGPFSSFLKAILLVLKFVVGFYLLALGIGHSIIRSKQESWVKRINSSLNGPLGRDIKNNLYNNSNEYAVYKDRIIYDKDGTTYRLSFAKLGYNEIPANNADAVCEWIRQNVVANPDQYYVQREHEEKTDYSDYTSGTPDTYTVTQNYGGSYDVKHYSGTSGSFGTKTVTVCYKLVKRQNIPSKPYRELKNW